MMKSTVRSNFFIIHTTLDNNSKQYILPIAEPIKTKCQRLTPTLPQLNKTASATSSSDSSSHGVTPPVGGMVNASVHSDEICLHSVSKSDILDTLTAFGYNYNHATLHIDISTSIRPAIPVHSNTGLWLRVPDTELTLPVTQLYHPALGQGYHVTIAMELLASTPAQSTALTTVSEQHHKHQHHHEQERPDNAPSHHQHQHHTHHQESVIQSNTVSSTIKNSTIKSPVINLINNNSTSPRSVSESPLNVPEAASSGGSHGPDNSNTTTPQPSNGKRRKQRKKLKPAKSIGEMLDRMAQFEQARQQLKSKNKACRSLGYSKGTITSYARRIQAAFNRGIDLQQLRQTKYRQLKKVLDQYAGTSTDVQTDIKWESDADDSDDDKDMDDDDTDGDGDEQPDSAMDSSNSRNGHTADSPAHDANKLNEQHAVPNYSTDKESAVNMLADTASMIHDKHPAGLVTSKTPVPQSSKSSKKSKTDKIEVLTKSSSDHTPVSVIASPSVMASQQTTASMPPPSSVVNARLPQMLPPTLDSVQQQMSMQPQPFNTAAMYGNANMMQPGAPRYYTIPPQHTFAGIQQYNNQLMQHLSQQQMAPNMLSQLQNSMMHPQQQQPPPQQSPSPRVFQRPYQ